MGPVFYRSAADRSLRSGVPGSSLRLRGTGGLLVCLILGSIEATAHAAPKPAPAASTAAVCQQAQARFDADDLAGAAALLDRAPTRGASDRELADLANLRGAIDLRRGRYDQARAAFAAAAARDPKLWAARFNAAEVSFRRGKYDEASQQFGELGGHTRGLDQGPERRLAQYKHLLAEALAGREEPAREFLAAHQGEKTPPLEYYYLSAALAHRHGQSRQAGQALAQAGTQYSSGAEEVYADSFRNLGWQGGQPGRLVAMLNDRRADAAPSAANDAVADEKPAVRKMVAEKSASKPAETAEALKPAFRTGADVPPAPAFREAGPGVRDGSGQMPPVVDAREPQTLVEDAAATRMGADVPALLGKPSSGRRPRATPTPDPSASPAADGSASPSPAASSSPPADPSATPAASPAAASQPGATPAPAFVQKYEAAYVKYLEKAYPEAKTLLDEADAIQPGQKSSADLRDLIFKAYYEGAYVSFRKGDYPTALEQLTNADGVKPNNPDSLNLRGLVFSRQRNYEQAESSFKKASQLDPTFYAAKFNYAELPFNYRNYTVARSRFEELFSQTDPAKQPVEAEITQFKVFLTLLLEGKLDAARAFMDHFNFTGATPARYFCQAALDFYAGNMEKAQGWIDSAGKEFKPQLVSIFKESFYRIGWMTDVNGQPALAGHPGPVAPPDASPAAVASALASPAASPAVVLALNAATPGASVPPASASPASTPKLASSLAASPAPTPIKPPAANAPPVTPTATVAIRTTAPVPGAAGAAPALTTATPTPEAESTPAADVTDNTPSQPERLLQILLVGFIVIPPVTNTIQFLRALARRKERMLARQHSPIHSDNPEDLEPEEAQTPR